MQSFLIKTVRITVLSLVAGAAGAVGNMLAMRYIAPVIEAKLPDPRRDGDQRQEKARTETAAAPSR